MFLAVLVIAFVAMLGFGFFNRPVANAQSNSGAQELSGFAWGGDFVPDTANSAAVFGDSGNVGGVGWISFSCDADNSCASSNYRVFLNSDNTLTGYAWSSNFGWIQFGGLSGCPGGGSCDAKLVDDGSGNGSMTGWARFVNNLTTPGWTGWIDLSKVTETNYELGGYMWNGQQDSNAAGDSVYGAGWINMNTGLNNPSNPNNPGGCTTGVCIKPVPLSIYCNASPSVVVAGDASRPARFVAVAGGGKKPYSYSWDTSKLNTADNSLADWNNGKFSNSGSTNTVIFSTKGLKTADAVVTDAQGSKAKCDPSVSVQVLPYDYNVSFCSPFVVEAGSTATTSITLGGLRGDATGNKFTLEAISSAPGLSFSFVPESCSSADLSAGCTTALVVKASSKFDMNGQQSVPVQINVTSKPSSSGPTRTTTCNVNVVPAGTAMCYGPEKPTTEKPKGAVYAPGGGPVTYYAARGANDTTCASLTMSCVKLTDAESTWVDQGGNRYGSSGAAWTKNVNNTNDYLYKTCNPSIIEF